jgi:hypothetical protein
MDSGFKMYVSGMKSVVKNLDPNIKDTTLVGWMQDISTEFPYYRYTNPQVMAIAKYMVQSVPGRFDPDVARGYIQRAYYSYIGKKSIDTVLIDVARYWTRLSQSGRE